MLLLAGLTAAAASPSAIAAPKVVKRKTLAAGVTYEQINDTAIPIRMYVLTLDPKTPATLDLVLSGSQIGTFAKTSTMAANAGALGSRLVRDPPSA